MLLLQFFDKIYFSKDRWCYMLFLGFHFVLCSLFGSISHTDKGTDYGEKAIVAYAESNHGPDGSIFLDPCFKHDIENLNNEKVLDAGCGAAPWAIYAAEHGGDVYAIDIQEGMIQAAKKAVKDTKVSHKISLLVGDVSKLPYKDNFFDKAISICVGCNLPFESLEKHFSELQRTLKNNGTAVIGAPTSLDVVFSNGSRPDSEILLRIQEVLSKLPDKPNPELIAEKLSQLEDVLSATFYIKNNRVALVTDEKDLQEGEKIWRKLPKLVVPNCYYSRDYYIKMFKKHNFYIEKVDVCHFKNEEERVSYNKNVPVSSRLGRSYVSHAPFIIFHVKKKQDPGIGE